VLGLATPGAETYHLIADKIAMRERLAAAVPHGRRVQRRGAQRERRTRHPGITRKFLGPAHFVEVGHILPAELDAGTTRLVEGTVGAALDARRRH
jgi:hypothetical protein